MYSSVPSPPQWGSTGPLPTLERIPSSTMTASPTSPIRTGRLRGLSYLRSYTQNHILSRDSHSHSHNHSNTPSNSTPRQRPSTLGRATSYPSPTSRGSAGASAPSSPAPSNTVTQQAQLEGQATTSSGPAAQRTTTEVPSATSARSSNQDTLGSTSGWVPTVGGQSAVSPIATEPQSTTTGSSSAVLSGNNPSDNISDLTAPMARTRSATVPDGAADLPPGAESEQPVESQSDPAVVENSGGGNPHALPSIRFSAHQDPRAQRPSLVFSPMSRTLPTGKETIKVGRYSERDNHPPQAANVPSSAPVGFKSKVVSRRHCEFWCSNGRWYIRDVKSSSGTFLNHIRLSSPGTESRPFPINDGDIVQLGIDFKGGEEMIFRCVKIRVELNKGWQSGPSSFNVQSHKRLRELNGLGKPSAGGSSQDCSICLGPIAPCQSLFVAPCSHTWHYKCIRVIINGPHWPHFICPNCRTVADLEAELDDPYTNGEWEEVEAVDANVPPEVPQTTEAGSAAVQQSNPQDRHTLLSEDTGVLVEAEDHSEPDHSSHSGLAEASDDSGVDQEVNQAAEQVEYLTIDQSPSLSDSAEDSHSHPVSNSTVAPVNIIRKASGSADMSHLEHPGAHLERRSSRTPSPNGVGASLSEQVTSGEGPMTPRNDVGPFVFDGSAGRVADTRLVELASMNLDAAAISPPPPPPTSHPA